MLGPGGHLLYHSLHLPHYHWRGRCGGAAGVRGCTGAPSALLSIPTLSREAALPLQSQAHSWTLQVCIHVHLHDTEWSPKVRMAYLTLPKSVAYLSNYAVVYINVCIVRL